MKIKIHTSLWQKGASSTKAVRIIFMVSCKVSMWKIVHEISGIKSLLEMDRNGLMEMDSMNEKHETKDKVENLV